MPQVFTTNVYSSGTYTVTVRHYGNGGSSPSNTSKSGSSAAANVTIKGKISTTIPTRDGYRFLGWAKSQNGSVAYQPGDQVSYTFSRSASFDHSTSSYDGGNLYVTNYYTTASQTQYVNLYAQWELAGYVISYDANGGTGAPAAQTKTHGENIVLSSVVPSRDNYVFMGWATSPTGAVAYQPGDTYTTDAALTLYAVWELAGSTLDSVTDPVEIGSSGTASWTIIDASYTHQLVLSCGTATPVTIDLAAGVASTSFTIPSGWLAAIPNAQSSAATATLKTYDGDTLKGISTMNFVVTVPSSVVPTISSFTASPYSENATVTSWDEFVQGFSYADLSVSAVGGTGASITGVAFSGPGISQSGTATTGRSALLTTSGDITYTVSVTDSRGRTATDTVTVTVYPYSAPTIFDIFTYRADADGTTNNSAGLYLKVQPVYSRSSVNGNNNFVTQTLSYCQHGQGTPVATITCASGTTYGPPDYLWAINLTDAYDVSISLTDSLGGSVTATVTLPDASGIWYGRGNDRLGLGSAPPGPGLYCDWDAHFGGDVEFQGDVNGLIYKMSTSLTSAGWYRILCYGTSMLATTLNFGVYIPESNGSGTESGEVHQVKYSTTYGGSAVFSDERSAGETLFIDKIRRTYDGTKNGVSVWAYDLHYVGGATRTVYVELAISGHFDRDAVFTEGLASVADAPSGESVFPEHSFAQCTEGNITTLCSFTKTSGSSGVENFWAYRRGNNVSMHIQFKCSGTISAGADVWNGTADVPLPLAGAATAAYYSQRAIAGRITQTGELIIRYVTGSGSFSSGNQIDVYFNYTCA